MDEQLPQKFEILRDNLLEESDRGCVLIAAAYLDDALESLLRTYFSQDAACVKNAVDPMFDGLAPLSSFSAKTKLAFALRLIDSGVFDNLELVRKIRNKFAHSFEGVALTSQQIRDWIRSLKLTAPAKDRVKAKPAAVQEEKLRFTSAVCYAIGYLEEREIQINENAE